MTIQHRTHALDGISATQLSTTAAEQKLTTTPLQATSVIVLTNKLAPPAPVIQSLLQKRLPAGTQLLGIGHDLDAFSHLTDELWSSIDVVLKWGGNTPIEQVISLIFRLFCPPLGHNA